MAAYLSGRTRSTVTSASTDKTKGLATSYHDDRGLLSMHLVNVIEIEAVVRNLSKPKGNRTRIVGMHTLWTYYLDGKLLCQ